MKINQIFLTLTITFFGLGLLCLCGVAIGKPTPDMIGVYFNAAKICAFGFLVTKIIGKIARKEIM